MSHYQGQETFDSAQHELKVTFSTGAGQFSGGFQCGGLGGAGVLLPKEDQGWGEGLRGGGGAQAHFLDPPPPGAPVTGALDGPAGGSGVGGTPTYTSNPHPTP